MGRVEPDGAGLGWAGLDWTGMGWAWRAWIGPGWAGLGWIGLGGHKHIVYVCGAGGIDRVVRGSIL